MPDRQAVLDAKNADPVLVYRGADEDRAAFSADLNGQHEGLGVVDGGIPVARFFSVYSKLEDHMSAIRRAILFLLAAAILATLWPAGLSAEHRRHARRTVIIVGRQYGYYIYDPFYPRYPFVAGPYGYVYYYRVRDINDADVRVLATPKDAEVYVDGYYAGIVDDFNGVFQRLHVGPGGHEFVLYREGYRLYRQTIYLMARATYRLEHSMMRLTPGEVNEPRPAPATEPPIGPPARGRSRQPPISPPVEATQLGTLAIRVQPSDAEVLIDGERWLGPDEQERLIVQLSEGRHHVEIRKRGYEPFATDVDVQRSRTLPLNVSLPPQRRH